MKIIEGYGKKAKTATHDMDAGTLTDAMPPADDERLLFEMPDDEAQDTAGNADEAVAPAVKKAVMKLADLCSRREVCIAEAEKKMQQWGIDTDDQAVVIEYLTTEGYIDESRYVRGFVHDKREYNHWGPKKIMQALMLKGIDKTICRDILAETDDAEWTEMLRPVIEQKRRTLKGTDYEVQTKLIRFAMSRGFEYRHISRIVQCPDF